jgi:hypothetical protein
MAQVVPGRFTASTDEPFVVFMIGMRINRPLAVRQWLPTLRAMGPMLKELYQPPRERLPRRRVFLPRPGAGHLAVLALLRGPGALRQEPCRSAHASLAALQPIRRQGWERRDLPRDLPRGAGELRGNLLQHARLRSRQSDRARQGSWRQGDSAAASDARGERTRRALARVATWLLRPAVAHLR